ncbi:unnamed protein product [Symbiodinium natans]|uniref:Ion transport domain-containing protein n=1 Tax=Symbiodinium natans TaxID=878477 RepID=A0A812LYA4_9DINO|nr:unnamed protein product [Symbiodinium natans]
MSVAAPFQACDHTPPAKVRRLGGNPGGNAASQELRQVALPHADAPKVLPIANPTAEDGEPSENIFVEVNLHALKGLPQELVSKAELAAGGGELTCQAVAHVGSEKTSTEWLPLQKEMWKANPNMVSAGEVTWEGVWEASRALNLCIPSETKTIAVDFWLPNQPRPMATTSLKVGAGRQSCNLDRGGFLEVDVGGSEVKNRRASEHSLDMLKSITPQPGTVARLQKMFRVRDEAAKVVMARDLAGALKATLHKHKHLNVPLEQTQLEEVMHKLREVYAEAFGDVAHVSSQANRQHTRGPSIMPWKGFLSCLLLEKLPDYATGQLALRLFTIQKCLLGDDCPTNMTSQVIMQAYEQVRKPVTSWERSVLVVTAISTILIACSFIATGISLDYSPDWAGWFYVDTGFAVVFILEVFVKLICLGPREYFCGKECVWNIFDMTLSTGAAAEIAYQVVINGASTPSRIALTIRVLRLARVSFYMRLINTSPGIFLLMEFLGKIWGTDLQRPLLTELSNIVQGFIIAVPSLRLGRGTDRNNQSRFWVMLTLLVIVYVRF